MADAKKWKPLSSEVKTIIGKKIHPVYAETIAQEFDRICDLAVKVQEVWVGVLKSRFEQGLFTTEEYRQIRTELAGALPLSVLGVQVEGELGSLYETTQATPTQGVESA